MSIHFLGEGYLMDMFDSPSKRKMSEFSSFCDMQRMSNSLHKKEISDMAHANTIFHQVLSLIPRTEFEALAKKYSTGRAFRSFSRWNQFACLLFIHLAGRQSMRDGIRSLVSSGAAQRGTLDLCRCQLQAASGVLSGDFRQALPALLVRGSWA